MRGSVVQNSYSVSIPDKKIQNLFSVNQYLTGSNKYQIHKWLPGLLSLRLVCFLIGGHLAAWTHISPVAKGSVEGPSLRVEQISDVTQTGDFKNLRLLLDDLTARKAYG